MTYILSADKGGECIFCPGQDRNRDQERLILYVGKHSMVIMNKFPYNNGHLLVAPFRHVPDLSHLSDEENLDLIRKVQKSIEILKELMNPDGFNVGLNLGRVAGAGMEEHMHFHIVPRWNGDTNFMTVFSDVRVIPQHIQETYTQLRPLFDKIKK
jgi:ATP adenylyltransferase